MVEVVTATLVENRGGCSVHEEVAMKTCLGQCCDEMFEVCPRGWLAGRVAGRCSGL